MIEADGRETVYQSAPVEARPLGPPVTDHAFQAHCGHCNACGWPGCMKLAVQHVEPF